MTEEEEKGKERERLIRYKMALTRDQHCSHSQWERFVLCMNAPPWGVARCQPCSRAASSSFHVPCGASSQTVMCNNSRSFCSGVGSPHPFTFDHTMSFSSGEVVQGAQHGNRDGEPRVRSQQPWVQCFKEKRQTVLNADNGYDGADQYRE